MLTCELQWLLYLLGDLSLDQTQPVYTVENLVFHDKTKYIEIDCHIVKAKFLAGIIKPLAISTHKQLAHLFTKSLCVARFKVLVAQLGVVNP